MVRFSGMIWGIWSFGMPFTQPIVCNTLAT